MDPTLRQRMELLGCSHLLQEGHDATARSASLNAPLVDPRYAFGINTAATVLPALGLSFDGLQEIAYRLRKPILDVGASFSTVACEAHWRGIPVFSTDLGCNKNRPAFLAQVEKNLRSLQELYVSGSHLPGNLCQPIPADRWDSRIHDAITSLNQQLSECPASDIRLPNGWHADNKHFSVVYSHHAIPQYCSPNSFLRSELPELLRVTAHTLLLHPFQIGDAALNPANEGDAAFLQTTRERASEAGFELQLLSRPTSNFPKAVTAVFTALA